MCLVFHAMVGNGGLQVILALVAWFRQASVGVSNKHRIRPHWVLRYILYHPVHRRLVVRGHVCPNENPYLPPRRYHETYHVRPIVSYAYHFPTRLFPPDYSYTASVVYIRLRFPYLVSRDVPRVGPLVSFIS